MMKLKFPGAWKSRDAHEALAPYLSPDQCNAEFRRLAIAAGAEIIRYGTSSRGRPLLAARIRCPQANAPAVLCSANIHGPEYIGRMVALSLLERIAAVRAGTAADTEISRLLARAQVWIIPCLNPDAYARVWELCGRGTMAQLRPNENGVDLNRQFPLPRGQRYSKLPFAGSMQRGDATYRGEGALCEPESAALNDLLTRVHFVASANLHSTMGTLIPAHVTCFTCFARFKHLCRVYRRAQKHTRYIRLSSRIFDAFTGELEDY
ncbi:MAG: M14 family metallopeptidase, partial [Terriglobales bacterium]